MEKVNNYYQFKSINESVLEMSKMFLNLLKSMKKDNIASKLLKLWEEKKDADFIYNFIDITNNKDNVSFTPEKKVKELLGIEVKPEDIVYTVTKGGSHLKMNSDNKTNVRIFASLGFIGKKNDGHIENRKGHIKSEYRTKKSGKTWVLFETIPDEKTKYKGGELHVLNKEALTNTDEDEKKQKIWGTARNNIKIGRIVRSLIESGTGEKVNDKELENFVNKFKSSYDVLNNSFARFEVVKGKDIAKWYNKKMYQNMNSTLGQSCMSNAPENTFNLYVKNPDVCNLLILYAEGGEIKDGKYTSDKICGRSLIWSTDEGDIVMDRVYSNFDNDVQLFWDFAVMNKWWYKTAKGYTGGNIQVSDGNRTKTPVYIISLSKANYDVLPYLDTFCFINKKEKKLSNDRAIIDADYLGNDVPPEDEDDDFDE